MSFYDDIVGVDVRAVKMDRMMQHFGVDDALAAMPSGARTQAVERCRSCSQQAACRSWLDAAVEADAPPSYCRNGQLIDDLSRGRTRE